MSRTGRAGQLHNALEARRPRWVGFTLALWSLVLLALGAGRVDAQPDADTSSTLVVGRISDNPKRHYDQLKALLDYVVPRMADVGIREGRVLMARDAQQMASYLRRGRVDWVTETPAHALLLGDETGARILVVTQRSGLSSYSTVIFARRDRGIDSLLDLRGRVVAFQNINSTSSYYAPAAAILATGLRLDILPTPDERPRASDVGYVFASSEGNIATWVHKGLVDAGAFSNIDWEDLKSLPDRFVDQLKIVHETPSFPRGVEIVRSDLRPEVRDRLRAILLAAGEDPQAREPLLRFFGTDRFVEPDAGFREEMRILRDSVTRVRSALP